jgi:hypothetical protein
LTGSPSSSSRLSHRVGERGRGRHAGRASQRQARRGFHGGSMAGQGALPRWWHRCWATGGGGFIERWLQWGGKAAVV